MLVEVHAGVCLTQDTFGHLEPIVGLLCWRERESLIAVQSKLRENLGFCAGEGRDHVPGILKPPSGCGGPCYD